MWRTIATTLILALLVASCGGRGGSTQERSPTSAAVTSTSTPAVNSPTATPGVTWPGSLGVAPVDAALTAVRNGDGSALLALVQPASAQCTTAVGTGGPPKCPSGVAEGTVVQYFPYFECDGWGTPDAAVNRLIGQTAYPLAVVKLDPPAASPAGALSDQQITYSVLLAGPTYTGDARVLTTLSFDGEKLREILGGCSSYSQADLETGELPGVPAKVNVLWRAYPASGLR